MRIDLSTKVNAVTSTGNLIHSSFLVAVLLLAMLSGCNLANEHSREENLAEMQTQQSEVVALQTDENSNEQAARVLKSSTREEPVPQQIKQGEHTLVKPVDKPWPPQPDPKPVLEEKPRKDSI
ncbi:hypothetical protein L1D29_18845 [Shewanella insulae]|uniref:Uncharacterized protein n=1 Tax=Shewanella insulae TaxID=2681496 RepID=A0A6L7HXR5_9GAMM|nr:hypothetical protein [Shewanella insulae]MCG9714861.1 hypothetical protein [Shewanella insulae]MXR68810.1 hypothetical protein [Shewanella insulae]